MSNDKAPIGTRADYPHFLPIPTRWMDNDLYGHVNNVVYYSYFDTVVNRYLIDPGASTFTRVRWSASLPRRNAGSSNPSRTPR